MTSDLLEGWLTTAEAQELTGYHAVHLRRLARQKTVTARKVGQAWIFERESLLAWQSLARHKPKRH